MQKLFTLLFLFLSTYGFSQQVSTWAGKAQSSGTTTNGASKTTVRFNKPWGATYDASGNIWITNEGSHAIFMYNQSDGKFYVRAGKQGFNGYNDAAGINAQFDSPAGITVGTKIYIADAGNHCIRQMDQFTNIGTAQSVTLLAGSKTGSSGHKDATGSAALFDTPTDVAVDSDGNVYVADQQNHCIRKITTSGVVTTYAGQAGSSGSANGDKDTKARFNWPTGLFIDKSDNIYVADRFNGKIRKIDTSGTVSTVLDGLYTPDQVFVDTLGTIYASNKCQLWGYNPSLKDTLFLNNDPRNCGFKNASDTNARFNEIRAILPTSLTEYLIFDRDNHVVRKLTIDLCSRVSGAITTSAATGFCEGDSIKLSGSADYNNSWSWSGGSATSQEIYVSTSGTYKLVVQDPATGCKDSDEVVITVHNNPTPALNNASALDFCLGDSVIISTQNTYSSYSWSNGSTDAELVSYSQGDYFVTVTDANGCSGTSDTLSTTVYNPDNLIISPSDSQAICQGDSAVFQANAGFSSYLWNTGSTAEMITVFTSGTYSLEVVDGNGCGNSADMVLTVNALPDKPAVSQANDSLYTDAVANSFQWYKEGVLITGATMEYYIAPEDGKYHLVVTNEEGCSTSSDTLEVVITNIVANQSGLKIWPNPADKQIMFNKVMDSKAYQIFNLNGQQMQSGIIRTNSIKLNSLEKGIYILQIEGYERKKLYVE